MPGGLARPIAVIAAACLLVVVVLGVWFGDQRVGTAFDQDVYWAVYKQFVGERALLRAMLMPTEPVLLLIVIGLIAMLAVARHRPRLAVLAVTGPLLAVSVTSGVLKPMFGRTINNGSLAFPSGHTAGMVSVLTVVVLAVVGGARPPWRASLTVFAIVGALVISVVGATGLIGMKYHYVTDTVGGACMAIATVLGLAFAIDWVANKRKATALPVGQPAQKMA